MIPAALLIIALSARAGELGGHAPQEPKAAAPAEDRSGVLPEMWRRRILPPDQTSWSPADARLLERIRRAEPEALEYLGKKFRGTRPWTAVKRGQGLPQILLTREGYEKYLFCLTQDAIEFFEAKGADAKWALKLTGEDGRRLFDPEGRITEAGLEVYRRARLKLEVYWKSPSGETFGTRRRPAARP